MPAMALPDQPLLADRTVDTPGTRSISFGASTGSRGRIGQREPVPVGPGRTASTPTVSFPIGGEVVHEFPLQPAKVQRPPLRREVLRRERLLDWLKVKIHHRVLLVIAEAGYGKTTLLADFARHHRRPTMWYRLDEEDRNWVSFLHYLVAAGREIEPDFAPATKGLLAELGVGDRTVAGRDHRDVHPRAPGPRPARRDAHHRRLPPRGRRSRRSGPHARAGRSGARAAHASRSSAGSSQRFRSPGSGPSARWPS